MFRTEPTNASTPTYYAVARMLTKQTFSFIFHDLLDGKIPSYSYKTLCVLANSRLCIVLFAFYQRSIAIIALGVFDHKILVI